MASKQDPAPSPTDAKQPVDLELSRWRRIYDGDRYYYGEDPGPVARRAVRYHRPSLPRGGTALDAGCGEGQDLAFLAECGYQATGVEFTPEGARKARRLLEGRGRAAEVLHQDLRDLPASGPPFDLVLAVNTLQFLGADALPSLDRLMERVAPGGVIGLSLFGREQGEPERSGTVWFVTLEEVLARFAGWQRLEAAKLWQWNAATDEAQAFVTLIARKAPPARRVLLDVE
jgi:SAM-dependent methyltransferase